LGSLFIPEIVWYHKLMRKTAHDLKDIFNVTEITFKTSLTQHYLLVLWDININLSIFSQHRNFEPFGSEAMINIFAII